MKEYISETEIPGTVVSEWQMQVISHRYYFAAQFISNKEVLEVGCGPGLGLGYLSRNAKMVVGGDIMLDSLRLARKHYDGRVGLTCMDAHKLPFRNDCFDAVICLAAVIYLDLPVFLAQCQHILKKDGVLILNSPNRDIPGFQESRLSNKYYSAHEMFNLLKKYNFDAELFGAFPVDDKAGTIQQKLRQAFMEGAGKILDIVPKGKAIKALLNKSIYHKTILKAEIDDNIAENVQPVPIPCDSPDFRHRILYVVARFCRNK